MTCEYECDYAGLRHHRSNCCEGVHGVQGAEHCAVALCWRVIVRRRSRGCAGEDRSDGTRRNGEDGMYDCEEQRVQLTEDEVELLRCRACGRNQDEEGWEAGGQSDGVREECELGGVYEECGCVCRRSCCQRSRICTRSLLTPLLLPQHFKLHSRARPKMHHTKHRQRPRHKAILHQQSPHRDKRDRSPRVPDPERLDQQKRPDRIALA